MILSPPLTAAIAAVVPILALIVIARVNAYRRNAISENSAEAILEPAGDRTPGFFLGRFTLPQRTYLAQQSNAARICFALFAYMIFSITSGSLITAARGPQQVWQMYQVQLTAAGYLAEVFGFVTALVVIDNLQGSFHRTRPLSYRFLFWGRVLPLLGSLLAATQAGLLASIVLLRFTYGPVWESVSSSRRSAVQFDLSMLTTTTLVFSIFVFVAFLPRRWSMLGKMKFVPILLGAALGSQAVFLSRFLLTRRVATALFLFPAQAGPQPFAFALVPLVFVAGLLFFGERLSTKFEI
jgi:hypothetical protein